MIRFNSFHDLIEIKLKQIIVDFNSDFFANRIYRFCFLRRARFFTIDSVGNRICKQNEFLWRYFVRTRIINKKKNNAAPVRVPLNCIIETPCNGFVACIIAHNVICKYISRWHTTYTRIAIDKLQGNPLVLEIRFSHNYVLIQFEMIEHNISAKKKNKLFYVSCGENDLRFIRLFEISIFVFDSIF